MSSLLTTIFDVFESEKIGNLMLKKILLAADINGITLQLYPMPLMDKDFEDMLVVNDLRRRLINWYLKNDFKFIDKNVMVRVSQPVGNTTKDYNNNLVIKKVIDDLLFI